MHVQSSSKSHIYQSWLKISENALDKNTVSLIFFLHTLLFVFHSEYQQHLFGASELINCFFFRLLLWFPVIEAALRDRCAC